MIDSDVKALAGVSRARAWSITVLAMFAMAVTLIDRQVLAALAVTVTSSLHVSEVGYGLLSSGFAGAYLLGSLPAAELIRKIGPRVGLAVSVGLSSVVVALHALVPGFTSLLWLRMGIALAVAPSLPCATQALHRVLPFRDRPRAIGLLYMGNSMGSALCPPLAVGLAAMFGWREAFFWAAALSLAWVPIWMVVASSEQARSALDEPAVPALAPLTFPTLTVPRDVLGSAFAAATARPGNRVNRLGDDDVPPSSRTFRMHSSRVVRSAIHSSGFGALKLAKDTGLRRGSVMVAAAAPITTVMLLWGTKWLVRDHGLSQHDVGHFLWMPPLFFGTGSLVFGELRARSARTRLTARPPRLLVAIAMLLAVTLALVPLARGHGVLASVLLACAAMAGAGGLYTLATSDMLANAPRGAIPAVTGLTTVTQSLVYIVANPLIGRTVELTGSYRAVMVGAGLWVLPGCAYWLIQASRAPRSRARRTYNPASELLEATVPLVVSAPEKATFAAQHGTPLTSADIAKPIRYSIR